MKMRIITVLLVSVTLITACSSPKKQVDTYSEVNQIRLEDNTLIQETLKLISNDEAVNREFFTDDLEIESQDIIEYANDKMDEVVLSNNALYIRFKEYMYRFQLDENGKLDTYIKYNVEA